MKYAGATHIILGAATMFAWGWRFLGRRRILIFAVASYAISLTSELIGTGTGWPFGNYAYTSFLGWKVLDHVPYTIPMSWFYMGLASYMIGSAVAEKVGRLNSVFWTCALGAWFLTVWDLVLDPAMAHSSLRVQFWVWHQHGAYFEMPIRNLIGWTATGLLFMVVSRLFWGKGLANLAGIGAVPLIVYLANILFAMAVSADRRIVDPDCPCGRSRVDSDHTSSAPKPDRENATTYAHDRCLISPGTFCTIPAVSLPKPALISRLRDAEHVPPGGPVLIAAETFSPSLRRGSASVVNTPPAIDSGRSRLG